MTRRDRTSWLWEPKTDLKRLKVVVLTGLALLLLEAALAQSGAIHEVYARINPSQTLPARTGTGHWVRMPSTPFIDIGWQQGTFSGERAVLAWREAGMNARQAALLVQQMHDDFSPVVMGVDDPAFERQLQARARQAAERWAQQWPQAHARLQQMQQRQWQPGEALDQETLGPWRIAYQGLTEPRSQLPRVQNLHLGERDIPQARGDLAHATEQAGLRGLRLWYADLETPLQMEATTSGLASSAREMERITGWAPGALGLYGRVFLSLRKPADMETEGATHDQDPGQITVECNWDTLSHEWFHALDLHLQREAFLHPGHSALSSNLGPLRQASNPTLVDGWEQARAGIIDAQPQWKWRRWRYALRHLDFYWVSDAETMAYAFAQHAMLSQPETLDSSWITDLPGMRQLVPNEQETRAQAGAWDRLLHSVRPLVEPAASTRHAATR